MGDPDRGQSPKEAIPQFEEIRNIYLNSFKKIRSANPRDLKGFADVIASVRGDNAGIVPVFSTGLRTLRERNPGGRWSVEAVDQFADDFFLTRIAADLAMAQFLQMQRGKSMLEKVNPAEVVRVAATHVGQLCDQQFKKHPNVEITDVGGVDSRLTVPPQYLYYVLIEILKNSMRATMDMTDGNSMPRPLEVVICADDEQVVLAVRDRGGGIPLQALSKVWSYLYTTALSGKNAKPTPLAGFGVGLPLSRLYAKYLGARIELQSLPGFGTDVFITMKRVPFETAEVTPSDIGTMERFYEDFFSAADGSEREVLPSRSLRSI